MILGLAGWSGSGKTTLIKAIIPHLNKLNISVSTIKHAHEGFEIDKPGKDSYVHRKAGANEVLVSSNKRFALIHEYQGSEMTLNDLSKPNDPGIVMEKVGKKRYAAISYSGYNNQSKFNEHSNMY